MSNSLDCLLKYNLYLIILRSRCAELCMTWKYTDIHLRIVEEGITPRF